MRFRSALDSNAFLNWIRRRRTEALMASHLLNWREVSRAFRTGSSAPPPLRFRNGLVLRGRPQDTPILLFFEVFAAGCYRRLADPSDGSVVADIGANIGAFTLDWIQRNPRTHVHAYEPDPDTCAVLRENVAANGLESRATIWNDAVARTDGQIAFERSSLSVGSRIGNGDLSVSSVSLATVLDRAGALALIKLDVEGAEADVLEAGASVLPRVRQLVGEYHEALVPGVRDRIEVALAHSHTCRFLQPRRCGSMFSATLRHPNLGR